MPKRTKKPEQIDEAVAGATVTSIKKQTELAGIEAPSHPELNTLMEEHATLSEQMGSARQRLGEINVQLEQEAEKLGVTTYRHPTAVPALTLTLTEGSTKVKVKKAKGDENEGDDE